MKKTHRLYVLVIFFSMPLTMKGMSHRDDHVQMAQKTPSLKKQLINTVTNEVARIIKYSQSLNEPIEKTIEKVNHTLSPLPFGIIEMIRTHLLCRYANKVYTRPGNGIVQYYDGHQETRAQRLDPNNPRYVYSFGSWSTWYNLELDELIKQFIIVRKSRKAGNTHPFYQINDDQNRHNIIAVGPALPPNHNVLPDGENFLL